MMKISMRSCSTDNRALLDALKGAPSSSAWFAESEAPLTLRPFEIGHPDLDWVQMAKGMGVPGTRVTSLDAFSKALMEGFASERPTLIEVPL